ncbi:glutathione S-transferase [Vandammella animalimorsus]|uniref:Glutathione S-transferase n=1 Tax=Vandammella animalimorsus TaxID=2029117 RepID=A0A2A2T8K9_9BURK|nr:glutathione S-transferase family protein [Vandammella animalimorsus]PAT33347.1 glutathione S-transferase [Vandammella animalimorsus]PAX18413.1 glutathione S-transferase [Vandammella animalimorsus]PAX20577.1 glutathione S-transferase [Vandammella animalimorsus]
MTQQLRIYGDIQSGNCYKVKLVLSLLGMAHEWVHVDILKGETRTDEFLAMNPNGKIPLLLLPDGRSLAESNAIIHYLAHGSALIPSDAFTHAHMLAWQFFEQYSHEPFIAVARFIQHYLGLPESRRAEYDSLQPKGHKALAVMEQALQRNPWLCGQAPTLADISLYAYTHVAHQGGFDLAAYPAITRWLDQVRQLPGYVGMDDGATS